MRRKHIGKGTDALLDALLATDLLRLRCKIKNDLAGAERVLRRGIANFTKGGAFPDIYILYNDLGALLDDKGDKRGAEKVY